MRCPWRTETGVRHRAADTDMWRYIGPGLHIASDLRALKKLPARGGSQPRIGNRRSVCELITRPGRCNGQSSPKGVDVCHLRARGSRKSLLASAKRVVTGCANGSGIPGIAVRARDIYVSGVAAVRPEPALPAITAAIPTMSVPTRTPPTMEAFERSQSNPT